MSYNRSPHSAGMENEGQMAADLKLPEKPGPSGIGPGGEAGGDSAQAGPDEVHAKPLFDLTVTADAMKALLRVTPAFPGQTIPYDDIVGFLQEKGITYGIDKEAIREFCQKGDTEKELICAKGRKPVNEEVPEIKYHFNTEREIKPEEKEDGSVDFRSLGLIQSVKKGDVLCSITPPSNGREGINVFSQAVPFTKARIPDFPGGSNTVVSEDHLTQSAMVDGCIDYRKNKLNVNEVLTVAKDVDNSSGNIDFSGTVIVNGDVRESFTVKAGKDIFVKGMVESARLEAGGDIKISNGMNGMGKGSLTAGGNVTGRYFENVFIACGGNVYADVLMHSHVIAEGSILMKGKTALMIGGSYEAGRLVCANTIGSSNRIKTSVSIASKKLNQMLAGESGPDTAKQRLSLALKEREEISLAVNELAQAVSKNSRDMRMVLKLKAAVEKKNQMDYLVGQLEASLNEMQEGQEALADYKIIGLKTIYAETKISIGQFTQTLTYDYSNTKFYADMGHLVIAPVLPSDRPEA